jgi:hypothetical protein
MEESSRTEVVGLDNYAGHSVRWTWQRWISTVG